MIKKFFHLFFILPSVLLSAPKGESVASGMCAFEREGNALQVHQKTDKAIVEWHDFSISEKEVVHFLQPSQSSAILNRVVQNNPSHIFGKIQANGCVLLINPSGVLVGRSAKIDTASFIASSLDVHDNAFLENETLHFKSSSNAAIENFGEIVSGSGDVLLIGKEVKNEGIITAKGAINLIASQNVSINPSGFQHVYILSSEKGEENTLRLSSGKIISESVEEKGGHIKLLGDQVFLDDTEILTGEKFGGGEIYIGGGFQGKDSHLFNSKKTYVGQNVFIDANASTGSGGKVIIWSDENTGFYGNLSAVGNGGGFAEISSKGCLDFRGQVDLASFNNEKGTLLLDPLDVIAMIGGLATIPDVSTFAANPGTTQTIAPATLDGAAANVTIETTRDMTFADSVTLTTAGASFTVRAGRDISLGTNSVITTGGDITFLAGPFSGAPVPDPNGSIDAATGIINPLNAGATTGAVVLNAYDITFPGTISTSAGNITLTANHDILLGNLTAVTGNIKAYANRNFDLLGSVVAFASGSGLRIDLRADANHTHEGNFAFLGNAGADKLIRVIEGDLFVGGENISFEGAKPPLGGNGQVTVATITSGDIEIQAANDFSMLGFGVSTDLGDSSALLFPAGNVLIRAGRDILFQSADPAAIGIVGIFMGTGDINILAGRNFNLINNSNLGIGNGIRLEGGNISASVGGSLEVTSGIGGGLMSDTAIDSVAADGLTQIFVGENITFTNNDAASSPILLNPTGGSLDMQAGGNIAMAPSVTCIGDHFLQIQADSTATLWTAQTGDYINDTVLGSERKIETNGFGGYFENTGPLQANVLLTTDTGFLHLSSSSLFSNGSTADLVIGPLVDQTSLATTSGDITVDPFHDIFITEPVVTGGNVLMIAQNTIFMNSSASISAGGDVQLVTDNQEPVFPGIGPGSFQMNPAASITAGGALRIFTARQFLNSILGPLNGNSFIPGTLFVDTPQEMWITYYPLNVLGFPFTIFYKDSITNTMSQTQIILSGYLQYLSSSNYYLGWPEEFTIDWQEDNPFLIRRPNSGGPYINNPKSYKQLQ